jgi:hypothetical protein
MLDAPATGMGELDVLLIPPASSRLGVDIDLADMWDEPEPEPEPELDEEPRQEPSAPAAAAAQAAPAQDATATRADPARELPPLDFDISELGDLNDGWNTRGPA